MDLDRYRLFASAIAGRSLEVAAAEPGDLSWTDGSSVFVDAAERWTETIGVQASLLAAGSLEPSLVRQLARRPSLARRYLAIEAHRALAANDVLLPAHVRGLIDPELAARVATPDASLELARSKHPVADPPAAFGAIHARRLLGSFDRGATAPASSDAARDRELAQLADEDLDTESIGHLLSSPVGGGGAVGRLFRRLLTPARDPRGGGPPGADAPTHVTSARPGTGRGAVVSTVPSRPLEGTTDVEHSGVHYPEWDVHRHDYRREWCTVIETDPPAGAGSLAGLPDDVALRRALTRLGIGLDCCRRQRQGDDIDIDAAVEARVDSLAGSPHDDDFYVDSLRRRRELAVLVLLDVSGSAGEPGTTGKTVHHHQRTAAAALIAALHRLGDRVALYAFNSRGRQAVHVLRVKAFDDHLDGLVAKRLTRLTPGAYTRLGAAIRHGTTILENRGGTPRRVLLVLSDGFAYDHGYEGRYGEADARRALLEARRRGVGCLCISVGADVEPSALRRAFGTAAHASVPRAEQLPDLIGPLLRAALRSAEAQRRAFQRKERTRERLEIERRTDGNRRAAVLRTHR